MKHNPDAIVPQDASLREEYYNRSEVSNSDLTELKNILHPRLQFGDKEAAQGIAYGGTSGPVSR